MTERHVLDVETAIEWQDWPHRLIDTGRMRDAGQRQVDAAKAGGRWPLQR